MEKAKYYSGIKRYITSRIKVPEDAEDLAQSVFLEFCRGNKGNDNIQNQEAYLFGIARKLIGRYYSQKHRESIFLQIDTEITERLSCGNYNKDSKTIELIEEIEAIISQLPPKAREAIELRLINGFSSKESAQKIGCSIDIFYSRFYEGLKILKEKMQV